MSAPSAAPSRCVANDGTVVGTVVYIDGSDNGVFDGVTGMHIVPVGANIDLTTGTSERAHPAFFRRCTH